MKKALVAGATGLIGKHLIQELMESEKYDEIRIISRRKSKFDQEKLVNEYTIDFDKLEKHKDLLQGIDDVFVCLGTTMKKAKSKKRFMKVDYTYPIVLAKLSKEVGVKRFLIVTAIQSDRDSRFFYSRVKGKTEEALVLMDLPTLHVFRPSLLLGKREELRFGEKVSELIGKPLSVLFVGPFEKYKPIKGTYVAKAMCAVAQEESKGVHIYESDQIRHLGKILSNSNRRPQDGKV
ncbi:NAD(P)H-binding protein [Evansella sp. AB-P1]|uniref:NAD(P)H-binding protein n=1 Tax=Evansella sp. AB-P1 TaxID=3037653 RepID=UPI00241FA9A2|nr:NAD(P)H-binding protein [Evansella sp. AB-P1]MDG5787404.1 NAD(P)H-binding protein [Evansella sp. AB-P1]